MHTFMIPSKHFVLCHISGISALIAKNVNAFIFVAFIIIARPNLGRKFSSVLIFINATSDENFLMTKFLIYGTNSLSLK